MNIYGPNAYGKADMPSAAKLQNLSEYAKVTYVNTQGSIWVLKSGDTMGSDLVNEWQSVVRVAHRIPTAVP